MMECERGGRPLLFSCSQMRDSVMEKKRRIYFAFWRKCKSGFFLAIMVKVNQLYEVIKSKEKGTCA